MRCSATPIFYHFKSCSGIWVSEVQRANRIGYVKCPEAGLLKYSEQSCREGSVVKR